MTVSELTGLIRDVLKTGFSRVGISGEISNLSKPRSGHLYFDIKDEGARIRAVIWRTQLQRIRFDLENGLAVRAWGGLDLYPPHGAYQIVVRQIEPEGIGQLELAFRQLFERLKADGLFDQARKRPLPRFPSRLVVVASSTGAAVRDILTITGRRWPAAEVLIIPVKVQGQGSAEQIASAIELANRLDQADLIIVSRGGGSLEDLWAFNEEIVARAIVDSRIPVLSGVGHETNTTIADFAADARAPTPSGAAELAVPDASEIAHRLDTIASRMARSLSRRSAEAANRLEAANERLGSGIARLIDRQRDRLASLAGHLDALSPLAVLSRGYSLTFRDDNGQLIRNAQDVNPGDRIKTRLASGSLVSRVETVEETEPTVDDDRPNDRS